MLREFKLHSAAESYADLARGVGAVRNDVPSAHVSHADARVKGSCATPSTPLVSKNTLGGREGGAKPSGELFLSDNTLAQLLVAP